MKCYDDIDEEIELFNKAIEASSPTDDGLMEVYEEYCEMMQREKSMGYELDAKDNKLSR